VNRRSRLWNRRTSAGSSRITRRRRPRRRTSSGKNLFDTKMKDRECDVTGCPRLYTEHMGEDGSNPSNPAHVLEIHRATRIACEGATPLNFIPNFRSVTGLRHIQPGSAHECLSTLRLWVKYHAEVDHYELFQHRSGKCGNLAIVEVTSLPREWIQQTGGGRTAIGRVTANGEDTRTLNLYAVEGTSADEWFARVKDGKEQFDDPNRAAATLCKTTARPTAAIAPTIRRRRRTRVLIVMTPVDPSLLPRHMRRRPENHKGHRNSHLHPIRRLAELAACVAERPHDREVVVRQEPVDEPRAEGNERWPSGSPPSLVGALSCHLHHRHTRSSENHLCARTRAHRVHSTIQNYACLWAFIDGHNDRVADA
jgi:hypothetical protein